MSGLSYQPTPLAAQLVEQLLGGLVPQAGQEIVRHGQTLILANGLVRGKELGVGDQAQTRDMFAYKWGKRDTYASQALADAQIAWLASRYGGRALVDYLESGSGDKPLILDAGMGSGFTSNLMFRNQFDKIRLIGVDISTAIDIAAADLGTKCKESAFFQCDLMKMPFASDTFDIVMSEGVIHHTPSTRRALLELARFVKPNGILALYVYAKKGPVREFTDDHIRDQVSNLMPEQAWEALAPLTKLGIALGELNTEIDVPEDVPYLGIKKGRIDIQRLFYWAVCKAYYRPELSFDEMNHINFDWFTPKYAFRQTPEEVSAWCQEGGLSIEHMKVEEAGITVVARKIAN